MTLKPPADPNNPIENPDAALENAENEFTEPQVFSGAQMGIFMDFANGVPGVVPQTRDPGTPSRADNITIGASGTLVYSSDALGVGLPMSCKFTTSGSASGYFSVDHPRNTTWKFCGRQYVRLSTASPSANIQAVRWLTDGSAKARIQIETNRTVTIRDVANTVFATSTTVLAVGSTYRFEWEVTPAASGTVTVHIYLGNETTPLESITGTGINIGTIVNITRFGSGNNGNIGSCEYYFSGCADALRELPGPYTGPPESIILARDPDTGNPLAGIDNDGAFFVCSSTTIQMDSARQKIRPGDVMFKIDPVLGMMQLGLERNMAKDPTTGISYFEGYHLGSGRMHAHSVNVDTINDPPDITFRRSGTVSPERSGATGSTLGTTVTLPGVDFHPIDAGRSITLDGTDYWIKELLGTDTCTVDDSNDVQVTFSTRSGLVWSIGDFPWPYNLGGGHGPVGQLRTKPMGKAFVRMGTDGVTNGTTTFTSATAAFTAADTSRYIMIADAQTRVYQITYVNATTVTLSGPDPVTASGQTWRICGGVYDEGAEIQFNPTTLGFRCDDGVLIFDDTQDKVVCPTATVKIAMADPSIFQGGSNNFATRDVWMVIQDGTVKQPLGDLYLDGVGKGVRFTQPNGSATKTVTLDNNSVLLAGTSSAVMTADAFYRRIGFNSAMFARSANITGAAVHAVNGSGDVQVQTAGVTGLQLVYIKASDWSVAGRTTKLRVAAAAIVNDTAPANTMTVGLYPVGTPSGGVGVLNPNFGTVVSGTTVAFATPAANSKSSETLTADIDLPADGWYGIGLSSSGAMTANSVVVIPYRVEVRNV